ncbi:hypothetical protein ACG33_14235 [Steroidobacter denitrificans]|uniref:PTS EIIA type-4 domain-containing protein n=2 Tax=Steroidobacter denitrificans TaxID=465721 RepID=A0A127FED0_STEDE|nr:hypothetical protein ACG33_14235 [Steroidobacter denitrificans]
MPLLAHTQVPGTQVAERATESIRGVELKGRVPVNPQLLHVSLPTPQEAVLSNGLQVFLLEDHKLPAFSLQFSIHGGGLADPPGRYGVAMMTAAMLQEGTQQHDSREIAKKFATLGASFGAAATPSSMETIINVTGLSENAAAILALAADVVRNPTFPADELEKFRARYLSRLQHLRSLPGFQAREAFMGAVYGEHPGRYVTPPESVLRAVTREELAGYHDAYYRPNNVILVVHGDLTLEELIMRLEKAFGAWQKAESPPVSLPDLSPPGKPGVVLIDRPGSVQTSLWVGSLGIRRDGKDYFPLLVMNHILGGGPASRLFLNLREDKGYTYGVSSLFTGTNFPGVVAAITDVRSEVTAAAIQELMSEIQRIVAEPVSVQELSSAKRALIGGFALSLDAPRALITNVLTQKSYGFPENYWDTFPQQVEAITADDIQRVAGKYYDAERLQLIAVGDGAALRGILAKYGEVQAISGQ